MANEYCCRSNGGDSSRLRSNVAGKTLKRAVTKVERTRSVQLVGAGFSYNVDNGRTRSAQLRRETIGSDLKLPNRILRDILDRAAYDVVVGVYTVNRYVRHRVRVDRPTRWLRYSFWSGRNSALGCCLESRTPARESCGR